MVVISAEIAATRNAGMAEQYLWTKAQKISFRWKRVAENIWGQVVSKERREKMADNFYQAFLEFGDG